MLRKNPNRWDIALAGVTLTMITDNLSHNRERAGLIESDGIKTLDLPQDERLLTITKSIESAMKSERRKDVRRASAEFLNAASTFYKVPACGIRVLAARPLRVRERLGLANFSATTHLIPC